MKSKKPKSKKGKPRRYRRRMRKGITNYKKFNIHSYKRYAELKNVSHKNISASTGATCVATTDYLVLSPYNAVGQNYYSIGLSFCMGDIPSYLEFSSLYDSYMLYGVKVNLYPMCSQGIMFGNGTLEGMLLHYIVDHDDDTQFTADAAGLALMKEYTGYKTVINASGTKRISIYIRPKISVEAYNTIATYGSMEAQYKYIDWQAPNIPHYGLKLFFEHYHVTTDAASFYWKVEVKYYFKCKDVR